METPSLEVECPLNGRRSVQGVYLKLFLSHCMILIALYHLARIRNESFPGFQFFSVTLAPFSIIIRFTIAIIYIAIYGYKTNSYAFSEKPSVSEFLKDHVSLLLFTNVQRDRYGDRFLSSPRNQPKARPISRALAWQTALTVVLLFINVVTILLYTRRQAKLGATRFDHKIFELACAGVFIGSLTLIFLFRQPKALASQSPPDEKNAITYVVEDPFVAMYSNRSASKFTSIDVVLCIGRDIWMAPTKGRHEPEPWLVWQLYFSGMLPCFTQLVLYLPSAYPCVLFLMSAFEDTCLSWDALRFPWFLISGLVGIFTGPILVFAMVPKQLRPDRVRFALWSIAFMAVTPTLLPMICGFLYSPFVFFQEYMRIFQEIENLQTWPVEKPCPLLWHDPLSIMFGWSM